MSTSFTYRITAKTDVGLVRDHNEDNFIVCPDLGSGEWRFDDTREYAPGEQGAVWVVADGMGGTNAGEVASNIAVEHVKKTFNELRDGTLPPDELSGDLLGRTLIATNEAIADHARKDPSSKGMGTTAVLGWLRGNHLHVSWIGDSRAYLFRNGRLHRLSRDHSLVQQLVDNGAITEEQAFHHPQSNIILQSLGDGSTDLNPGHADALLQQNDVVMLCTDGLNGMVMDPDMEAILQRGAPLDETAEQLIAAAKAAGGHDNITVVLVSVLQAPVVDHAREVVQAPAMVTPRDTAPTTAKEQPAQQSRPKMPIAVLAAFILGMLVVWLAFKEGGFLSGESEHDVLDSTAVGTGDQREIPIGGTKEDGTSGPAGKDQLKETDGVQEPAEDVIEQEQNATPVVSPPATTTPRRREVQPPAVIVKPDSSGTTARDSTMTRPEEQ